MSTASASLAPSAPPTGSPSAETLSLAELRPIAEIDRIGSQVLEDMGLGSATASTAVNDFPATVDFSVLHFIILPKFSAWLDFMVEADRASALKIFETFGGTPDCTDADLEDVLRETMNLIHGSLKVAFKEIGMDVIIPVVPQSIAPHRLNACHGGFSLQSRYVFVCEGITLRLTMIARVAPVIKKQLKNFRLAEVLVDPIATGDEVENQVPIVKRHTMINKRLLKKVLHMADYEPDDAGTHAIIEPSVLAELLPNE